MEKMAWDYGRDPVCLGSFIDVTQILSHITQNQRVTLINIDEDFMFISGWTSTNITFWLLLINVDETWSTFDVYSTLGI